MSATSLFVGAVVGTKYVLSGGCNVGYVSASPNSGTVLVEVTGASETRVNGVIAGTPDALVLWEPWDAGDSSEAAYGAIHGPWTAVRITATDANVNVSGGVE